MDRLPANYPPRLNIRVENYESGVFEVGRTIKPIPYDSRTVVDWANIILLYKGDQSNGSALFGIGMINKIVSEGGQSVLIYRDGDTPVYPEYDDENGGY